MKNLCSRRWLSCFALVANYLFLFACVAVVSAPLQTSTQGWNIRARPLDADFSTSSHCIAWSSDGRFVALQGNEGVAIRDGRTFKLRHFLSRSALGWTETLEYSPYFFGSAGAPRLVAFSGNRLVFYFSRDDTGEANTSGVDWRDVHTGRRIALWKNVNLTEDLQALFFVNRKKRFRVYHFTSQRWFDVSLPLRMDAAAPDITDLYYKQYNTSHAVEIYFSRDGLHAADQIGDGRLRLWNVKTRRIVATLEDKRGSYVAWPGATGPISWSPDGNWVATLGEDPEHRDIVYEEGPNDGTQNEHSPVVKVWNARTGKLRYWERVASQYGRESVTALRWLDSRRLAVFGPNSVEIWDTPTRKTVSRTVMNDDFHLNTVESLSPDGKNLVAVATYKNLPGYENAVNTTVLIRVLQRGTMTPRAVLRPGSNVIEDVTWSNNGKHIATTIDHPSDGGVRFWSWNNRKLKLSGAFPVHSPTHFGWTRQNRFWTSDFYRLTLWDAQQNWKKSELKAPHIKKYKNPAEQALSDVSNGLFLTSDEKTILQIADSFDDPQNSVWRSDNRQKAYVWLQAPSSGGFSESISPDGRFYCVLGVENSQLQLTLYDLQIKRRTLVLHPTPRNPKVGDDANASWEQGATFSRDGKVLAFGGRIFSLPQGQVIGERQHPLDGSAQALSSRGEMVVRYSATKHRSGIWLFETKTGKPLRLIARDLGGIAGVDFSPDNKLIVVARFGDLELYDVALARLVGKSTVLRHAVKNRRRLALESVWWK